MKAHFLCLQCGQQASNEFRQEKGVKQSIPLSLSGGQPMAIQVGTPRNPHQVNTVFRRVVDIKDVEDVKGRKRTCIIF